MNPLTMTKVGETDLRITRPLEQKDVDATAPVRLDLYMSGGGS